MTLSDDFVRSWLRSSRTVSWFGVDVLAAAGHEADDQDALERRDVHLRLDGRLDRNLVVIGAARERDDAAHAQPRRSRARDLLFFALAGPVIDFLEKLVVLTDLSIVRVELDRFLVRLARLVELALVLVGDREIVERRRVGRVELRSLFPAVRSPRATSRAARR